MPVASDFEHAFVDVLFVTLKSVIIGRRVFIGGFGYFERQSGHPSRLATVSLLERLGAFLDFGSLSAREVRFLVDSDPTSLLGQDHLIDRLAVTL